MSDDHMTGAHFRALRTHLGYSVADIADYLGVSINSARAWDKGAYSPPPGVVAELGKLQAATELAVTYLSDHYSRSRIEWPMEIPRTADQIDDMRPQVVMPGPVTVDWWKHVGIRVCERVPGLTLEWA